MDAPVQPGDILAQKYRVERVLGVGGMGVVVAATQVELDRIVAMKFMLDEAFQNVEARSRFLREARAAVRLRSEHVARVLDTGTLENGAPYIVMEFLDGTDLAATLQTHGPLPIAFAVECIVQACDALAEAHAQGIVHRDLKPANLFVTQRPDGAPLVKLLDFGISKVNALSDTGTAMTKTSALMGSPLYMSPEQMRSAKDVDQRTDVWSLGVVLYEMIVGAVPFRSPSLGELLYNVMTLPHVPLSAATPRQDVPSDVSALVDWCLQKDPAHRAPDVGEIARRLAPHCPPRTLPTVERISAVMHAASVGAQGAITGSGAHFQGQVTPFPSQPHFGTPSMAGASAAGGPVTSPVVQGPTGAPHAQTSAGWSGTSPGRPSRSATSTAVAAAVIAATAIAIGIGVLVLRAPSSSSANRTLATSAASTTAEPSAATSPALTPSATVAPAKPEIPDQKLSPAPPTTTQAETTTSAPALSARPAVNAEASAGARPRPARPAGAKPRATSAPAPANTAPEALPDGTR
jgi:serine/threonine-protein kinase